MSNITDTLTLAFKYCDEHGIDVPLDLQLRARRFGAVKATGDMAAIRMQYHDAITQALIGYFEGGTIAAPKNEFRRAALMYLGDAFDLGWTDGGGSLPLDEDAVAWLDARINTEFGFIAQLFEQAKELRKDTEADTFAWSSSKADSYTATLDALSNAGKLRAAANKMLTFDGEDGDPNHICQSINGTCVRLKGQRHKASWWIAHNLVPYRGNPNYDCGAWECQHYLADDSGKRFTV